MFEFTYELARLEPPPPEMQQLPGAAQTSQEAMDGFVSVAAGTLPAPEFFGPENAERIMAGAAAGAPGLSSRTVARQPGAREESAAPIARCVLLGVPPSLLVREPQRKDLEMAVETITSAHAWRSVDDLRIDFLFLDLTTCTRCLGADRNLESALEVTREVLAATGVEVEVDKVLVESEEQARALRFVSSPTIRINGHDVALELRESSCGSEACTDGCGDEIACRVWVHRGQEHTEPPVAMIVDAILRHVYHGGAAPQSAAEPERYALPENMTRFFAGKAAAETEEEKACCPPSEQESCCDPSAKENCCGTSTAEGCGCQ